MIRPIISAFIGFVSSTCEDAASAALDAIEPITELKTFDRNSNQNLITGTVTVLDRKRRTTVRVALLLTSGLGPINENMSEAIDQAFRRKESKIKIHIGKFENIADKKRNN